MSSAGAGLRRPSSFHEHQRFLIDGVMRHRRVTSIAQGVRLGGGVGGGHGAVLRLPGGLARFWFWAPVRPEPCRDPSGAGAWRLAAKTQSPHYPKPMGKAMAKRCCAALEAGAARESGRLLARGSRNWHHDASQTPNRSSSVAVGAPRLQALIAAHGGRDLRVFGLLLPTARSEPERMWGTWLVDFPASPQL